MRPLERLLKANYDIWKYTSKGMKEFHCNKCAKCCNDNGIISLTFDEYNKFKKIIPNNLVKRRITEDIYVAGIKGPCPFVKDNLCSIYEERPYVCKLFPLMLDTRYYPFNIRFDISSVCPNLADDEMIQFTYEEYLEILKFNVLYYNPSDWEEYQEEISRLDDAYIPQIKQKSRTWCSVCCRTFKDKNNHIHPLPDEIDKSLDILSRFEDIYKDDKITLSNLLFKYLRNNGNNSNS